jgi:hypothetical protein
LAPGNAVQLYGGPGQEQPGRTEPPERPSWPGLPGRGHLVRGRSGRLRGSPFGTSRLRAASSPGADFHGAKTADFEMAIDTSAGVRAGANGEPLCSGRFSARAVAAPGLSIFSSPTCPRGWASPVCAELT